MMKTSDEFNTKYLAYIEKGFNERGLELDNPEAIEYLDKEFQELIKIPGFQFSMIKSKYSWFCFYCDNVPREKVIEIQERLKEIYGK